MMFIELRPKRNHSTEKTEFIAEAERQSRNEKNRNISRKGAKAAKKKSPFHPPLAKGERGGFCLHGASVVMFSCFEKATGTKSPLPFERGLT
jgi:hypothetical protein